MNKNFFDGADYLFSINSKITEKMKRLKRISKSFS
jgi:hypothetical protein